MLQKSVQSNGFTLVETIVAVGIITLVLVSTASTVSIALRNNRFAREKTVSTRLAQEAIEWARAQRDAQGFIAFYQALEADAPGGTTSVEYCLDTLPLPASQDFLDLSHSQGTCTSFDQGGVEFTRTLSIELVSSEQINLTSAVTWEDDTLRSTSLSYELHQW
jgi:Type II secretory pathway, pseudopilin PulG